MRLVRLGPRLVVEPGLVLLPGQRLALEQPAVLWAWWQWPSGLGLALVLVLALLPRLPPVPPARQSSTVHRCQ